MIKIDESNENLKTAFLEPIKADSFLCHQLLKLFTNSGLEDFEAQVLLSVVLYGGQVKPITIANVLDCDVRRLELPDAVPSLINRNLLGTSHHRPKTIALTISIQELIGKLKKRSMTKIDILEPELASDILKKIDKSAYELLSSEKKFNNKTGNKPNDFETFKHYFTALSLISKNLPNLQYILDFALVSFHLDRNESILLSMLYTFGGKTEKRGFYNNNIKNIDLEKIFIEKNKLKNDLLKLGYNDEFANTITSNILDFYNNKSIKLLFSTEQSYNMILANLSSIIQVTSMGVKGGKRKYVGITALRTLTELANLYMKKKIEYEQEIQELSKILKLAYENVKLVDADIFLSSISDPSSSKRRIETDLAHSKQIYLSLIHKNFAKDLLNRILITNFQQFSIEIIISDVILDYVVQILTSLDIYLAKKKEQADHHLFIVPIETIPQDILSGNTLIMEFSVGRSMISIPEKISKNNPIEVNMIVQDVENAIKEFSTLKSQFNNNYISISF